MNSTVFSRLFRLFLLILLVQTMAMAAIDYLFAAHAMGNSLSKIVLEAACSGLIALLIAIPLARAAAQRTTTRLERVIAFARHISSGERSARLSIPASGEDEFSEMENALNLTAEHLDADFAELESGRQELAAILDSMQEGVVAMTRDGLVRWSNSAMQHLAGAQFHSGRPLVHSVRDPEFLACVRGALERRELCFGRATSLSPRRVFEVSAAPLSSGGALVVLHDVTSIEAAQKSRREFVANVSHELRTPLTSIQG